MKRIEMKWQGVIPAMTTAFKPDYSVDHAFVGRHARWLVDNGCTGIVALGSLGESATLRFDEKVAILKTLVNALGGKGVPTAVGKPPALFVTLTAPSFGVVHTSRPSAPGRRLCDRIAASPIASSWRTVF